MSFSAQFQPRDVRDVSGWADPKEQIIYLGMSVANGGERVGYNHVTFQLERGEGQQLMRQLLTTLTETLDALESGTKLQVRSPWPPEAPKGGAA